MLIYSGKASLKRCVLTIVLNVSTDLTLLMLQGRVFHRVGAATLKDQSVKVLYFVLGILSSKLSSLVLDLSPFLCIVLKCRSSIRYTGPSPCRHL